MQPFKGLLQKLYSLAGGDIQKPVHLSINRNKRGGGSERALMRELQVCACDSFPKVGDSGFKTCRTSNVFQIRVNA